MALIKGQWSVFKCMILSCQNHLIDYFMISSQEAGRCSCSLECLGCNRLQIAVPFLLIPFWVQFGAHQVMSPKSVRGSGLKGLSGGRTLGLGVGEKNG